MPDTHTPVISRRHALRLLTAAGALGVGAALGASGLTGCAATPQAKQGTSDTAAVIHRTRGEGYDRCFPK